MASTSRSAGAAAWWAREHEEAEVARRKLAAELEAAERAEEQEGRLRRRQWHLLSAAVRLVPQQQGLPLGGRGAGLADAAAAAHVLSRPAPAPWGRPAVAEAVGSLVSVLKGAVGWRAKARWSLEASHFVGRRGESDADDVFDTDKVRGREGGLSSEAALPTQSTPGVL